MTVQKFQPTTSFSGGFHSILKQAAKERITLDFGDEKLATRFVHRVHQFRSALRREKHPDWEQYYSVGVYKTADPKKIVIAPRDSEFAEVFKSAGIEMDIPPAGEYKVTTEGIIAVEPTDDAINAFLSGVKKPKLEDL